MALAPILLLPASPENRAEILDILAPLGREVLVMDDPLALNAELLARQYQDGVALILLDSEGGDDAEVYALINRLMVEPAAALVPLLWLAPGLADDERHLYGELLHGIEVLCKPCLPAAVRTAAADCLSLDENRRAIQTFYAGADWDQTQKEGLLGLGSDGRIWYANRAAAQLLRMPARRLSALYWQSLMEAPVRGLSPKPLPALEQALAQHSAIDVQRCLLWRGDGSSIVTQAAVVPLEAGVIRMLFAFRALPENRESGQQNLADIARLDLLTGLPMRPVFEQATRAALHREGASPAVLVMDIDHLRHINETLGYELGDQLLQAAARRLREAVMGEGMLARIAGDRFASLVERVVDYREAGRLAQRFSAQFKQPFLLAGHEIYCGLSVGVALFPGSGDDAESLLQSAEVALDRAKTIGRNTIQFYSAELNRHSIEQLERETTIHRVLALPELPTRFLPWHDAAGRLVALSVELDWESPAAWGVSTGRIVEESGLACALGRRLLQSALLGRQWPQPFPSHLQLMFQMPASCLREPQALARLRALLARQSWDARRIQFNLVLSGEDWTWLEAPLQELGRLGLQLGLSLGRHGPALEPLCRLPWQQLLLDPFLIQQLLHDRRVAEAVGSLIEFGHRLHLQVLASGVESEAQKDFLFDKGVNACAGVALASPVAAVRLPQWLAENLEKPGLAR